MDSPEQIDGFWIPKLLAYHDELWIVEMDFITKSPYILDFAKVRIDRPPGLLEGGFSGLRQKEPRIVPASLA